MERDEIEMTDGPFARDPYTGRVEHVSDLQAMYEPTPCPRCGDPECTEYPDCPDVLCEVCGKAGCRGECDD